MTPDIRPAVEQALAGIRFPQSWPAFDGIRYDWGGRLWVKRPARDNEVTARWEVFSEELELLGSVSLPARLWVQVITDTTLYGVLKDDMGIPYIKRYRIVRP